MVLPLLDVYHSLVVCLVSFVVCLGTSIVEFQGRVVPGTARCVEPWSKTDLSFRGGRGKTRKLREAGPADVTVYNGLRRIEGEGGEGGEGT